MSAHGFKSVFMVAAIAGTALSCYMVSLRVASERAALETVENKIVLAQRDIRLLNTEIGTRGRLAQLERWNVKVIRLSAPSADQFVENSFQLATLVKPQAPPAIEAPIVYASAPAPVRREPVVTNDDGSDAEPAMTPRPLGAMLHVASYSKPAPQPTRLAPVAPPLEMVAKTMPKPLAATAKTMPKPLAATARTMPAVATKPVKTATADPLGPLSGAGFKAKSDAGKVHVAANIRTTVKTTKESGSD